LGTIGSASYGAEATTATSTSSKKQKNDDIETPLIVGHRRTFSKRNSDMLAGPLTTTATTTDRSVSDTAPDRKRSEPIARSTPQQQVHRKGGESTFFLFVVCLL
jgi:hypothetical protein